MLGILRKALVDLKDPNQTRERNQTVRCRALGRVLGYIQIRAMILAVAPVVAARVGAPVLVPQVLLNFRHAESATQAVDLARSAEGTTQERQTNFQTTMSAARCRLVQRAVSVAWAENYAQAYRANSMLWVGQRRRRLERSV